MKGLKNKIIFSVVFLFIGVVLCAGCGLPNGSSAQTPGAENTVLPGTDPTPSYSYDAETVNEKDTARNTVPFEEMAYERPDIGAMAEQIYDISQNLDSYGDMEELENAMEDVDDIYYKFQTMGIIAIIHSLIDRSDDYWLGEELYMTKNQFRISQSMLDLYKALHESSFKSSIEEQWTPNYFEDIGEADFITDETQPLYMREAELINEYNEMITTSSIEYDSTEYTYSGLLGITDLDTYTGALKKWYEEYNIVFGNMYIELVGIRNRIAHELGYENYFDMSFNNVHSEYDTASVETYVSDIAEYFSPVYEEIVSKGRYYPDIDMDYNEFYGLLREALDSMSVGFAEPLEFMTEYGLCDYEPLPDKQNGAYTLYIADYDAPFIVCSYAGDFRSINTFVHEFGHFFDYYTNRGPSVSSRDKQEVASQAMELLFSNYFYQYFGADAGYMMQYDSLFDAFITFPEQASYTSFEIRAYEYPEGGLTVDILNDIYREECNNFGIDVIPFGNDMLYRYNWVTVPHIYASPFYTLSYATSQDVSLQIWELSAEGEQPAVAAYEAIVGSGGSGFLESIKDAGLVSPIEPGRIKEIADSANRLIIEDGLYNYGAAA